MRAANKSASVCAMCCYIICSCAADASRVVTLLPQHLTSHLSPRKSRRRLFDSALIHYSLTDDAAIVMDTRIYLTTWSKSCAHSSTVRRAHSPSTAPIYNTIVCRCRSNTHQYTMQPCGHMEMLANEIISLYVEAESILPAFLWLVVVSHYPNIK